MIVIEEYIEGRNLSDILNEYRFSEEEGCHILKEVSCTLSAAYGRRACHMQGFKAGKYYADFAESCEAVNECKEGKAWRKYLPPGFRTGTAWKMILAVTGYLMVMSLSFSMEIKEQETVITGVRARTQQILFLMSQLLEIGFMFNYLGLRDTLPLLNSKNYFIRALGCVVLEFILIVIVVLGTMLLDALFW